MPRIFFNSINTAKNTELFFWHIEESPLELTRSIKGGEQLLEDIIPKTFSYKRKLERLSAIALLQTTQYRDSKILYHNNGQPYLNNREKYISISHSKDIIAIAISSLPVGVDIEAKRCIRSDIGRLFLNSTEIETFISSEDLLNIWTVKEAAYKLAPLTVRTLNEICVYDSVEMPNCLRYYITYPDGRYAQCDTFTVDNFVLSLCYT